MFWQSIVYEAGKGFLKVCCASRSVFGCSGRTDRRQKPCLVRYFPIVRTCSLTSNSSSTRACKATQRHRTTPSFTGSGPASTHATNCACCLGDNRGFAPLPFRSDNPSMPSALKRCAQSRSVCRSIPLLRAAVSRSTPSSTSAMASSRRTTPPILGSLCRTAQIFRRHIRARNLYGSTHDAGAQNWAMFASIIETCKLNKVEPHAYLTGVLTAIAQGHKQKNIAQLLPLELWQVKHRLR